MSWVEEARKLIEDFAAPELRAIASRLDAAEKMNGECDQVATERHSALLDKLESNRRKIMLQLELAIPKGKLEDLQARQQVTPSDEVAATRSSI
jgi:hypothetical protein